MAGVFVFMEIVDLGFLKDFLVINNHRPLLAAEASYFTLDAK
jgi:hypothetical protein